METKKNSNQKIGMFLKRNFHSLNSLIENPTEFKWLGLSFQEKQQENKLKFEAEFSNNSNIEYNSDNREHIWYKNINMPKIKVSQISFYPVEQLKAEVMIFGGILSGDFLEVVIKGKNQFNFHLRECTLKGIRVGDTSHNLKGKQLHIVISISSAQNPLNIHYVLVSSGILIFGRKKKFCQRIDTGLLIEPFVPYLLREQHDFCEETEGLVNYLTSKKIRHKILHPLYLFMQFSKVFQIYYNKDYIKSQRNIAYTIQELLLRMRLMPVQDEVLIIRIIITYDQNHKEYFQKIQKQLNQLQIRVLSSLDQIPRNFEKLKFDVDLLEEYRINFKEISYIKIEYMKKLMNHPQKIVQINQEGYEDTSSEFSSNQFSIKSQMKEPFNQNILNLNIKDDKIKQQLIRVKSLKC